ncbi:MAG: class II aldolase/adducin family protein [Clostridiales bacterium]|nr:class II aldolase/adducin family protein [Clostridiales bacterium]
MDMDIMQAKQLVIDAGKTLLETGLIARTWGNVSCRVSDTQFVITPSGRAYDTLTPEEIVLVNIENLSYDGDVKPSSEKGIHAAVYKMRPQMNFVIHTHQINASVISALGMDINNLEGDAKEIIGDNIPLASYGLPGTSKLREGVIAAMQRSESKGLIMAHHGALCMGADYNGAFAVASELEKVCEQEVLKKCNTVTNKVADSFDSVIEYVVEKFASDAPAAAEVEPFDSERDGEVFNITDKSSGEIVRIDIESGALVGGNDIPDTAQLHLAVYKKRKDVNSIIHSKSPDILTASRLDKKMKPLLDDFAQLVGTSVKTARYNPNSTLKSSKKVVKALKGRNAVLLKDNGALCVAGDTSDAQAVEMVMEKGCKTQIGADLYGKIKPISPIEAKLMRIIYLKKYSKQKK